MDDELRVLVMDEQHAAAMSPVEEQLRADNHGFQASHVRLVRSARSGREALPGAAGARQGLASRLRRAHDQTRHVLTSAEHDEVVKTCVMSNPNTVCTL